MTNFSEFKMAVLTGRSVRKFITKVQKKGVDVMIDRPNHKRLMSEGATIFSALKYSTGWDCRVHNDYVELLKSCF